MRKGIAHRIAQAARVWPAVALVVMQFGLKRLCAFGGIPKVHVAVLLARIGTSPMHPLHIVWQREECTASFEAGGTRRPQLRHPHHKESVALEGGQNRAVHTTCEDVAAVYA
jgi:hypothetical protein